MTLLVHDLGVRPPEFRFKLLSIFLPFNPLFLGFGKDPRNVLLRVFALDPRGGLLKRGTCASHVCQPANLRPIGVRGLTAGYVIGGANVPVHDLTACF